ncbi:MAG: tetratricopeptide repeat protein [Verrucomicrobia bacterium]|nr:tetratricopeptide repeat protein [Verrucomicrobiota bacterium]
MRATDPALPRSPARIRAAAALLAAAGTLAYLNSFAVPFLFDDLPSIVQNPAIRHLWPPGDVLFPAQGGLTTSGRPLVNLSLAFNYAISGTAGWSYHALNLLIHLGAGLALLGLVRRTLLLPALRAAWGAGALPCALAAAALWMLHPLQTESVTYIVQRAEALMGLCYLLTLYAFVRAADSPAPGRWLAASVGACLAGMASKEVMVSAPLMVLLYDRTFVAGSFRAAWQARRRYYLALAGTWVLLGALVLSTGGDRGGTAGFGLGVTWSEYGLTQFQAIMHYLRLSVWPQPLIFEYGLFSAGSPGDILPYALPVGLLFIGTLVALWRRPALGFLGAWFFALLAPTSLVPSTVQLIVEHRMYLALAAVMVALALAAHRWLGRQGLVVCLLLAAAGGGLTVRRNADYRTELGLWADTVQKRPQSIFARQNYGQALLHAGRTAEAIQQHEAAVQLRPDDATMHYNLGLALFEAGQTDAAIAAYGTALRLKPDDADVHSNLGVALAVRGQPEAALRHHALAARLEPSNPQFNYNLGLCLTSLGRTAEAIAAYETAVHLDPGYADAQTNLGTALAESGRLEAGISHYAEAVRLTGGEPNARKNLGHALLAAGRAEEAAVQFRATLVRQPSDAEGHLGLGDALAQLGRLTEAASEYAAAVKLQPALDLARERLEQVQAEQGRRRE